MPREWNAETYDQLPLPHEEWGERTLARLRLRGDETVLDAGAGTGRDTLKLLDRLPEGRVVAADGSRAMIERLRAKVDGEPRAEPLHWDLTTPVPTGVGPFDAVFSVATFHWVFDHERLFENLALRMIESGMLVSECGGRGNASSIEQAVATTLGTAREPRWHFADVESTESRLTEAGFEPVDVRLRPHPVTFDDPEMFRIYLATVVLGPHLDAMDDHEGGEFLSSVIDNLDETTVDYVRLEITARRT